MVLFSLVRRRLDELQSAVRRVYVLLDDHVQEAKRRELHDPIEAVHEVVLDGASDGELAHVATFRGPVPRVGESIWTDDGAWRVTDVAWWVRSLSHGASVSRACVYVTQLRADSRPNPR